MPKRIPKVLHIGSNYDYHFIRKELAEELKTQFTCLRENNVKYVTFTVQIEKDITRICNNGEEINKNISGILKFIDSARDIAHIITFSRFTITFSNLPYDSGVDILSSYFISFVVSIADIRQVSVNVTLIIALIIKFTF